jgi:hypothetical protein
VQDDLEARRAQQGGGATRAFHVMSAFVDLKDMVIQTLRAHLHFRHAEVTEPADSSGIDLIGSRLDDKPTLR